MKLLIDTVGGKKLAVPVKVSFRVENAADCRLENSERGLKEVLDLLVSEEALTPAQADHMFKGYPTERRKLLVFESGHFIGRPDKLPPRKPSYPVPPFGFEIYLVVVKSL